MKLPSSKLAFQLAIVAALVASGVAAAEAYYERASAERLMANLRDVEPGTTSKSEVKEKLHDFVRFRESYPEDGKPSKITFDQFVFRNRGLAFLHLSPATYVWVTVEYRDGFVYQKSFQYFEEPRCSGGVVENLAEVSSANGSPNGRDFYMSESKPSPYFRMKVTDNASIPLARRRQDMEVDLSCMTRIGGCRDPRLVLKGAMAQ